MYNTLFSVQCLGDSQADRKVFFFTRWKSGSCESHPGYPSHCLTVWCCPLTDSLLSCLSVGLISWLWACWGIVLPMGTGQQDCAGYHCLNTFIPQSGTLTIGPCAGHSSRLPRARPLSAGPEILEGWMKGPPPPSTCFSCMILWPAQGQ